MTNKIMIRGQWDNYHCDISPCNLHDDKLKHNKPYNAITKSLCLTPFRLPNAHVANCMCYKVHMLQRACVTK